MSLQSIVSRHLESGESLRIEWTGEIITQIQPAPESHASKWLAPCLFDVQVNGYNGVDFQGDDVGLEDLLRAVHGLRQAGCTTFLLTLITDEWPRLLRRLNHLRDLRQQSPELIQAIRGWHLEGPFLSPEPGYHGAHNPAWMLDPSPRHLRELAATVEGDAVLLTMAPERQGVMAAVEAATAMGWKVSLGHSNASAAELAEAIRRGARGFTHLANACPRELDRHDNIVWRVMDGGFNFFSLIPDGMHVSPPLFRLIHRAAGKPRIIYTSDAMAAAGAPPGRYRLGTMELEVGGDQIVRQPGKTNFAGSALRPIEGVLRATKMLGGDWREAWRRYSVNPAALMGWDPALKPGMPADFCLLTTNSNGNLEEMQVWHRGRLFAVTELLN